MCVCVCVCNKLFLINAVEILIFVHDQSNGTFIIINKFCVVLIMERDFLNSLIIFSNCMHVHVGKIATA